VGRDVLGVNALARDLVSIHAPRVGRDRVLLVIERDTDVSIHAPRVGRDL